MLIKEWLGYRMVKKLWRYVKPFLSDTGTLRMDGHTTDGQTDGRYAISISRVSMLTRDKNIYRRRSWVYDTVGHAPLAIDRLLDMRTTKWQKQLPRTMQCRSHSRRRTIECLFVTACSMDEYAEEKRIEKNVTVYAETTNGFFEKPMYV